MLANRFLMVFLLLYLFGIRILNAQNTITVYPQPYSFALKNPLKGFRDNANTKNSEGNSYATIVRDYIKWDEIETDSTDGVEKIIDFCNARWKDFEKKNIRVIPRVYILWDKKAKQGNWPADLTQHDWSSQKFKDRIVKLIYKLGLAWDNDPRVAWVQTGLIGYWGEQEKPVGVHEDGWTKRLGEAYSKAFKNKKLLVRNQKVWESEGFKLGTYWDSYAHPGQERVRSEIRVRNEKGRYLTQVVEGETAYDWGKEKFFPKYGSSPTITCNSITFTNNLIDVIRELHCTGLGWVSRYKTDGSEGSNIDSVKANASRIQEAFGYNFRISEFSCVAKARQGSPIKIRFTVKNDGSAPFYENWPVTFVLIDETTHEVIFKQLLKSVDVRKWLPGDDYSYETRAYKIPAKFYTIDASITVPATVKSGNYMAGISILEPYSQTPGIFFDIKNFLFKSQTQPLCRIGIGTNLVGSYEIDPALFGDPFANDTRHYSLTPQGFGYTLSTTSNNGVVVLHPAGGKYLPGTEVTIIAKGNKGYKFNSWSGGLSGTRAVSTVVMDRDKGISANFEKL